MIKRFLKTSKILGVLTLFVLTTPLLSSEVKLVLTDSVLLVESLSFDLNSYNAETDSKKIDEFMQSMAFINGMFNGIHIACLEHAKNKQRDKAPLSLEELKEASYQLMGFYIPQEITNDILSRVIVKYAEENPEELVLYPTELIHNAFKDAFKKP